MTAYVTYQSQLPFTNPLILIGWHCMLTLESHHAVYLARDPNVGFFISVLGEA